MGIPNAVISLPPGSLFWQQKLMILLFFLILLSAAKDECKCIPFLSVPDATVLCPVFTEHFTFQKETKSQNKELGINVHAGVITKITIRRVEIKTTSITQTYALMTVLQCIFQLISGHLVAIANNTETCMRVNRV